MVAVALAFIAILWAFVADRIATEQRKAVSAALAENRERVDSFEEFTIQTLALARVLLDHAASADRAGSGRGGDRRLDSSLRVGPFIFLTMQTRDSVLAATDARAPKLPAADFALAEAALRNNAVHVSRPVVTGAFQHPLLAISRRIPCEASACLASAWIEPRSLLNFAVGEEFEKDDLVSLVGLDGVTRARRTGDHYSSGEDLSGRLVMRMQLRHPNGSYRGPSAIDGIERYFSHRRIPGYPLFVTSGVTIADALKPASFLRNLYLAGTFAVTGLVLLSLFLVRRAMARSRSQMRILAEAYRRMIEAQRVAAMGDWHYEFGTDRLWWSPVLCEMYQRSADQSVSTLGDVDQYLDAANGRKIREAIDRVIGHGTRETYELDVTLPDGSRSTREIVAIPTRDADGAVVGVHGTDQDITEREKTAALDARLSVLSRIDAMNALAATLAHELNQPLAAASNYLSTARRMIASSSSTVDRKCRQVIDYAARQIHDSSEILRSARALVANDPGSPDVTSLAKALNDSIKLASGVPDFARVDVAVALSPGTERVCARPAQLRQVLFNLLKNAVEAVDGAGAKIRVTSHVENGAQIVVRVSDNGPGMPKNFDPFSALATTKTAGLGLGLSISRTIVEAHGGKIWIEETGPSGTTVGFSLRSGAGDCRTVAAPDSPP